MLNVKNMSKNDLIRVALDEKRRLIERYRVARELQRRAKYEELEKGGCMRDEEKECIVCEKVIDTETEKYFTGESLGEYWCSECGQLEKEKGLENGKSNCK